MKARTSINPLRRLILGCAVLAVSLGMAAESTNPPPQDNSATLRRLQDQLDLQTKRIDRLYKAIGPHLAELEERAVAVEKQEQEDKALALEPIREIADESLTSIGCVNPAAAEFGVITDKPAGAVLNRASGQPQWTFRGFVRHDFYTLAGAMNGQQLVVLEIPGQPRGAFLLDDVKGEVLHTRYDEEHGSGPLAVGLSPDGNTLAVGYAPYDIILWNAPTGERQRLLKGHSNWVVSLAFSADSKRLISGAGDSTARIWDMGSGKEVGRVRFQGESSYVDGVGLSPKGDIAFAVVRGVLVVARVPADK